MSIFHGTFFLSSQFGGEIVPVLVVVLVLEKLRLSAR
jgi:hypothetical protein